MEPLTLPVAWDDVALRLGCAAFAGALIGINREAQARPAGLRTTLLVCLAASLAMLQANILLASPDVPGSIIRMDVMRLPLGVLSGIGFIGAGAILRRADMVLGVTTAATLWMVTVIGLCFGGGQIALGLAGLAISLIVLWGLKYLERFFDRDLRATLTITVRDADARAETRARLRAAGFRIASEALSARPAERRLRARYDLRWRRAASRQPAVPDIIQHLASDPALDEVVWEPRGVNLR